MSLLLGIFLCYCLMVVVASLLFTGYMAIVYRKMGLPLDRNLILAAVVTVFTFLTPLVIVKWRFRR